MRLSSKTVRRFIMLLAQHYRIIGKSFLALFKKKGLALQYASEELRNHEEIVLAAVQQDSRALRYASHKLQKDLKPMVRQEQTNL
ncbi:hypothetical protein DB41_IR00040 [Neochlamydia sp. TUME1]|nr:hypothetical protein DB41_IR00040 [Neochlamydia sp. TUME1]